MARIHTVTSKTMTTDPKVQAAAEKIEKETDAKRAAGEKKDALPRARQLEMTVKNLVMRIANLQKAYSKLSDAGAGKTEFELMRAAGFIQSACEHAALVPDDVKPKPTGPAPVDVGTTVSIKTAKRANYEGLLPAAQLVGMKVVAVKGKKVLVQTPDETKVFISVGDVTVDE